MTWEEFGKLPETLAALEQRIAALEKEKAGLKTDRQEKAPGPINSKQACEDIRNILQQFRSQQNNLDNEKCDITDIVFLRANGAIQCISIDED
jgi:hypothetical protein